MFRLQQRSENPGASPGASLGEPTATEMDRSVVRGKPDPGREVQNISQRLGATATETRAAFQRLHRQYLPFTYALAARKSHPDDVDDVLQETWIGVWKRLQDPVPVERFLALLEVICRRKIADAHERRFRRKRSTEEAPAPVVLSLDSPRDGESEEGDRWQEALPSADPLPETALLHREKSDELWGLLDRLPENWRLAVIYRFFNQMSVQDTSKAMNSTEDAIKKYVFRAVRRLREWMAEDPEFWLS